MLILMTIVGVAVASFTGSLCGIYCGLRVFIPTMKMLLKEAEDGEKATR